MAGDVECLKKKYIWAICVSFWRIVCSFHMANYQLAVLVFLVFNFGSSLCVLDICSTAGEDFLPFGRLSGSFSLCAATFQCHMIPPVDSWGYILC